MGLRGGKLALPAGFEPATRGLEDRCSIQLSYGSPADILRHPIEYWQRYSIQAGLKLPLPLNSWPLTISHAQDVFRLDRDVDGHFLERGQSAACRNSNC